MRCAVLLFSTSHRTAAANESMLINKATCRMSYGRYIYVKQDPGYTVQKSVIPRQHSQFLAVKWLSMYGTGWYLVVLGQYRVALVDT